MNKKGKLILVIGPSGVGKGTAIKQIRQLCSQLFFPTSYTTRQMRQGEKQGETYNFITKPEFEKMIKDDAFLEYQLVHNTSYYGTDKASILENIEKGKSVIREMDIQGVKEILDKEWTFDIVTIFITTDSWETLKSRILKRSQISEQELENRKQSYLKEIEFLEKSNHVVYSEENKIDKLIQSLVSIINNETC